jgi:hypothetical protein
VPEDEPGPDLGMHGEEVERKGAHENTDGHRSMVAVSSA